MNATSPADTSSDATVVWGIAALDQHRARIRAYFDEHAEARLRHIDKNRYLYSLIDEIFRRIIDPQSRVLQVGCKNGFFLDAVAARDSIALDTSAKMVSLLFAKHPNHTIATNPDESISSSAPFDYVLITNVNDVADVFDQLSDLKRVVTPNTRVIVYNYNRLWEPIVRLAERIGLKYPQPENNWLSLADTLNLLAISGYQDIKIHREILLPINIPLLAWFANRVLARLPLIRQLCLVEVIVARLVPPPIALDEVSVSIVVPCKNEAGNIATAVARIPNIGRHTEIIFGDDKSTDGTPDEVRRMQQEFPDRDIKLVAAPGISKSHNVWTCFDAASGDILLILDADLTVMPEKLPQFVQALAEGRGEFINGSRMVYPMQSQAMRTLNIFGNKGFSYLFRLILGQPIRDTLCGTKVFWRRDWPRIKSMQGTWGAIDRWGDFELLFGAAKLYLKIVDLPVHYQDRVYGSTKMTGRFKNAAVMARICWAAFLKLRMF